MPIILSPALICFGEVLGLISNAPDARLEISRHAELGFAGAESNVAIALARLGHGVSLFTALGDDPFGWRILKSLRGEGVGCGAVEVVAGSTTALMLRDRPAWGEPSVYYYRRSSAFAASCAALAGKISLSKDDLLFLSGITPALGPECLEAVSELLHRAKAAGAKVWFDVNFRSKLWTPLDACAFFKNYLPHMHGVFTSRAEAGIIFPNSAPDDLSRRFLGSGVKELVVKAGKDGAIYSSADQSVSRGAFPIPREIDPIGAGDAFNAGFLSARIDRLPIEEQLERGCALGALACLNRGDWEGSPTRIELERFLQGTPASIR